MIEIPIVSIGQASGRQRTVGAIEDACRDVGFIYVVDHGIDPDVVASMREAVVAYFSQAPETKLRDCITRDNYRGYIPAGFFSPNVGGMAADSYEGYKLHFEVAADDPICAACDLYGPNRWPDRPDGFRDAILRYWRACDSVSMTLLGMLAESIGIDPDGFVQQFEKPLTNMTLLHYPPQSNGGFGIHPHKDTDALTILAGDQVQGLMVRRRNGKDWIDVDPPAGALVVNIGDMMELWSGGYFVSTPHKVASTGNERYSFPYFAVPRYDVVVKPLCEPQPGFDRADVNVGDVSREVWRTNWPDTVPHDTGYDLGTLED